MKSPLDPTDHEPDPRSRVLQPGFADGRYVYVQDGQGDIWVVLDDRPHLHLKVLGHRQPAKYAGDLTIRNGRIVDITNCSGTFQFDDEAGLRDVVHVLRQQGWEILARKVKLFSHTQAIRPRILE